MKRHDLGELPEDRSPESDGDVVGAGGPRQRRREEGRAKRTNARKTQYVNRVAMTNREYQISDVSVRALPANVNRRYIIIVNTGTETVFVSFTNTSGVDNSIPILSQGNYEPWVTPYSELHIRTDTGLTSTVVIGESFYENVN